MIGDDLALVAPWDFPLEDVAVPVTLRHGDRDTLITLHHAEYVADRLPAASLRRCAGDGHLAMFGHQRTVLEELAALSRRARP